jgi:hypothetical protein
VNKTVKTVKNANLPWTSIVTQEVPGSIPGGCGVFYSFHVFVHFCHFWAEFVKPFRFNVVRIHLLVPVVQSEQLETVPQRKNVR